MAVKALIFGVDDLYPQLNSSGGGGGKYRLSICNNFI